jgi:hypothetical protein
MPNKYMKDHYTSSCGKANVKMVILSLRNVAARSWVALPSYGLSFSLLAVVFAACLTHQTALLLASPVKVHTVGDRRWIL